jgi:hypothetical protein
VRPNTQKAPSYITYLLIFVGLGIGLGLTYQITPDKSGDGGMEALIIFPFVSIAVIVLTIAFEKYFYSNYKISNKASLTFAVLLIIISLLTLAIAVNL